jgi:hypothetical protein
MLKAKCSVWLELKGVGVIAVPLIVIPAFAAMTVMEITTDRPRFLSPGSETVVCTHFLFLMQLNNFIVSIMQHD